VPSEDWVKVLNPRFDLKPGAIAKIKVRVDEFALDASARPVSVALFSGTEVALCRYGSPRHRLPFHSINEGSICVG